MWDVCDRIGLSEARHRLFIEGHIPTRQVITAWIDRAEREERAELERKQHALNERSVSAAEESAAAAIESAKTSGASARAAQFAALVSFAAFVVAVAAYFKQ